MKRLSSADYLRAVLKEACVLSIIPIVCACLVDAWLICYSNICVISEAASERNCDLLCESMRVGKYACLVMTSTMHRSIVLALTFCVG